MELWQTVCIALIQGITEFLPISSSAHLLFPSLRWGWSDQGLYFDVAVHAGSLCAVVFYFREQIQRMLRDTFETLRYRQRVGDADELFKLAVATIPIVLVGAFALEFISQYARALTVIVFTTIFFGVLLGAADIYAKRTTYQKPLNQQRLLTYPVAFLIGVSQIFALVPGTSRAGVTITCALFLGLSRSTAAQFSFLLAIPVIIAAFTLTLFNATASELSYDLVPIVLGFLVAGVTAFLCIWFFMALIERIGLMPFVIYRIAIGLLLGAYLWL